MALVWITGLSGSGKTTLATTVADRLRRNHVTVLTVDGDGFRREHEPDLSFDRSDRLRCALALSRHCHARRDQAEVTLVSTISLFHEVHALNRQLHHPYLEILLTATPDVLQSRRPGQQGPRVGHEIKPEYPRSPHLSLRNDRNADFARNVDHIFMTIGERLDD